MIIFFCLREPKSRMDLSVLFLEVSACKCKSRIVLILCVLPVYHGQHVCGVFNDSHGQVIMESTEPLKLMENLTHERP